MLEEQSWEVENILTTRRTKRTIKLKEIRKATA
jgi:hypothetical protein